MFVRNMSNPNSGWTSRRWVVPASEATGDRKKALQELDKILEEIEKRKERHRRARESDSCFCCTYTHRDKPKERCEDCRIGNLARVQLIFGPEHTYILCKKCQDYFARNNELSVIMKI